MRVDSPVSNSADALILGLLKQEHHWWLDSQGFEQIDLGISSWEAIYDPTVDFAVALFESVLNQGIHDVVRHRFTRVNALADDLAVVWVDLDLTLKQFLSWNVHDSELLRKGSSLSGCSGTWRSN